MLLFKKTQIYLYFFLYFALLAIFYMFPSTSLFLMFSFLFLVLFPGFLLQELFKIPFSSGFSRLVFWFVLGFIFNLMFAALAIVLGFKLSFFVSVYPWVLLFLFAIALFFTLKRPSEESEVAINFKSIFKKENIFYLLLFILVILVLSAVEVQGADFKGDPYYHLSIMRKMVGGYPLTIQNLSYVKDDIHPAYAFPLWHLFLTLVASFNRLSIFSVWWEAPLVLALVSVSAWYFLMKKILPTKTLAILATSILVTYIFFNRNAYLFTRLPVPDTLGQLILLPLSVALALDYVFEKGRNYKNLIVITLFVLFMAIVHFTQYFYFIIIMAVFLLVYAIFGFSKENYKATLKKIALVAFSPILVLLPFLTILELKGNLVSSTAKSFQETVFQEIKYSTFNRFSIYGKTAYLFAPLLLVFIRKHRQLIFLLAISLVVPLLYSQSIGFIKMFFFKTLGFIFLNRLYANTMWHFAMWAVIIGFILLLIDRLISKAGSSKIARILIDLSTFALFAVFYYLQVKNQTLSNLYNRIFSQQSAEFLNNHFLTLLIVFILLGLGVFLSAKKWPKVGEFFKFSEYNNSVSLFFLSALVILFLISPSYDKLIKFNQAQIKSRHAVLPIRESRGKIINPANFGGQEVIDFINEEIPPKSTFISNGGYFLLPLLVDQHMGVYNSTAGRYFQGIYLEDGELAKKLQMIDQHKVEYILYHNHPVIETYMDTNPAYFKKIFQYKNAYIYKVNTKNISDYLKSQ
ncbi:MAG: hypothetical protein Q7R53_00010 [bacterium]|nr:hypothetical protein [bacterium]